MIKFRAWDKVKKCLDDDIFIYSDGTAYDFVNVPNDTPYIGIDKSNDFIIMQSIGLKDKNGVEIFCGDLLDFDEKEWGASFGGPEIITMDKIVGKWDLCGSLDDVSSFRAVVGNIHSNPELLTNPHKR